MNWISSIQWFFRLHRTIGIATLMALWASGCAGPRAARPSASPDEMPGLSLDARARAEALAHYSQGLLYESDRNVEGALTNFIRAAELDPDHEGLQIRIAVLMLQQKRQDEAVELLERYVKRAPKSERALTLLAIIYRAAENLPRAEHIYQRIIKAYPDKQDAYVELAGLYLRQARIGDATALLEKASRRVPKPGDLLRALGTIYLEQAKTADTNRNLNAALSAFERALAITPQDTALLYQLGDVYAKQGDLGTALRYFFRIEDAAPDNLPIKQRLALALMKSGERDAVITQLEAAAVTSPVPQRIYYYLGDIYTADQDDEKATEYYERATTGDRPQAAAFVKLAVGKAEEDPDQAITILLKGLDALPGNIRLMEMLALFHYSQEKFSESLEYFEAALKQADGDPDIEVNALFIFNYGIAAQRADDFDRAATMLNRAVSLNPAFLDAYLQVAFRQEDETLKRDSITVLEKMGELQPGEPNVYLYLGLLNSYLKSYAAAILAFEKVERLVQDSPQQAVILDAAFYFWYGAACEREKQYKRAEQLFLKCIELDPQHSEALNYLAYMWAEQGMELERAMDLVQRALKINPTSGAFIDTLGWIYYMQGEYEKALAEINRAAELIPDDPTILDHLGDVFFKLGDEEQAIPHWKRSFVLDPENKTIAEKLTSHGVDLEPLRGEAEELLDQKNREKREQQEANRLIGLPNDGGLLAPMDQLDEDE